MPRHSQPKWGKTMSISISESLEHEAREAARRKGVSTTEFIEAAVQSALAEFREQQIAADWIYDLESRL